MNGFKTLAATLGICGALFAAPAGAATTWDYYAYTGVTHPVTVFLKEFAKTVGERTDGELVINVRPAGELPFGADEAIKATGQGLVQMGSVNASLVAGTLPRPAVFGLPFLIRTYEDLNAAWPIVDKHTAKDFEATGTKVLFHWGWSTQNIFGVGKPIEMVQDIAGRKLRTTDPKQAEMLRRLNASAVTLTTAEVPVAMERGTMEGVVTAAFNLVGAKWYEFVQWGWMPEIHVAINYEVVNLQAYNALDENVRTILDEVAAEYQVKMLEGINEMDKQAQADLETKYGLKIVRPSAEEIDALTEQMVPYWDEWAAAYKSSEMVNEIRQVLNK